MRESDAKKKLCPIRQVHALTPYEQQTHGQGPRMNCIASDCMWWVEAQLIRDEGDCVVMDIMRGVLK